MLSWGGECAPPPSLLSFLAVGIRHGRRYLNPRLPGIFSKSTAPPPKQGNALAYTPFCDNNRDMDEFRFWKGGFWETHLRGKPYHISALYVIDLARFRRQGAGDHYRCGLFVCVELCCVLNCVVCVCCVVCAASVCGARDWGGVLA